MALTQLQSPYARFHGKTGATFLGGGTVSYSFGNANYARAYAVPSQPNTDPQIGIRAILAQVAQGFAALSTAQADAWNQAASGVTSINPVGGEYSFSGIALYSRINTLRLMAGQSLTATPPSLATLPGVTAITSFTANAGDVLLTFTHGGSDGVGSWLLKLTADLGSAARKARPTDLRLPTNNFSESIITVTTSPQTIDITPDRFTVAAGQNVGVSLTPLSAAYVPGSEYFDRNYAVTAP